MSGASTSSSSRRCGRGAPASPPGTRASARGLRSRPRSTTGSAPTTLPATPASPTRGRRCRTFCARRSCCSNLLPRPPKLSASALHRYQAVSPYGEREAAAVPRNERGEGYSRQPLTHVKALKIEQPSPARSDGIVAGAALAAMSTSLPLPHHPDEALEQVAAVARSGRGLRVVLHREHRPVLERDAAGRAVVQRDMGLDRVRRQGRAVDREAVVHRGDLDLAGGEVFHRMVGAVVALVHLAGLGADRDPEHLVTEADAEGRDAAVDDAS